MRGYEPELAYSCFDNCDIAFYAVSVGYEEDLDRELVYQLPADGLPCIPP